MKQAMAIAAALVVTLSAVTLADGIGAFSAFKNGVGARALAMGGAFVAVANDATAPLWNPAGLAQLTETRLTGMSSGLSELGASNQYLGAVTTFADIGLGLGWNRASTEGAAFTSIEQTVVGSLATNVFGVAMAGANVKYYRADDGLGQGASGFGFDLGLLVNVYDTLMLGVNAMDPAGSSVEWEGGETDEITSVYKAGMAMTLADDRLILATDVDLEGLDVTDTRVGIEYRLIDELAVRGGVVLTDNFQNYYFAVGAGIKVAGLYVDAAYVQEEAEGSTLVISAETQFTLGERSQEDRAADQEDKPKAETDQPEIPDEPEGD